MDKLPNGYIIKRRHLHTGNSSKRERHGSPYVTISNIVTRDGEVVATGKAICNKTDQPNKFIGRTLADARALAQVI